MAQPIYDASPDQSLTEEQRELQERRTVYLSEQRKLAADHLLSAFTLIEKVESEFATGKYNNIDIFDVPQIDAYLDAVAVIESSGAPMPEERKALLIEIEQRSTRSLEQKLGA